MREHGKSARKRAWRTVRTESSVGYIVAVAEDETRSVRSPELTAGDVDDAIVAARRGGRLSSSSLYEKELTNASSPARLETKPLPEQFPSFQAPLQRGNAFL